MKRVVGKRVQVLGPQEYIGPVNTRSVETAADLAHGCESVLREPSLQALDERRHVPWAMAQQRRRGGHDVGAGEKELNNLDVALNARSRGEGQVEAPRQQLRSR